MISLTEKEILVELKKFGINSTSELDSYVEEYKKYYVFRNIHVYSPKEYKKEIDAR